MISAKARDKALDLLRAGVPQRETAKRCKISKGTVALLARTLRAAPADPLAQNAPAPDEPDSPGVEDLTSSATALTREIAGQSLAIARIAKQDGNSTAASRALKTARESANDLRREELAKRKGEERLFTREELEAAMRSNLERVAALAADLERTGGPVCSSCGRALRLAIASGGVERPPVTPSK